MPSKDDFNGFVDTLAQMLPEIKSSRTSEKEIEKAGGIDNLK